MSILIAVYTFLICWFVLSQMYLAAIITVLTIPFTVLFFKLRKILLIKKYRDKVELAKENFKNGIDFEPFINANTMPWYVLDLIPGVTRVMAKKLANHVKRNDKIKDFREFADFCGLEIALYELVKKIIKF